MYLNALEFLEEERETFRPFEALEGLTDEQLDRPISDAHDWSGRDLMGHLVAWIEYGIEVAKELAVNEQSPTKERMDRDWDAGSGDAINARDPGRVAGAADGRGSAAVPRDARRAARLPDGRAGDALGEARRQPAFFLEETIEHYADHVADLEAILDAAAESARPGVRQLDAP